MSELHPTREAVAKLACGHLRDLLIEEGVAAPSHLYCEQCGRAADDPAAGRSKAVVKIGDWGPSLEPPDESVTLAFDRPLPVEAFCAMMGGLADRYPDAEWVTNRPGRSLGGWPITMTLVLGEPAPSGEDGGYGDAPVTDTSAG